MQKSFFLMKLLSSMPFLKGESYYLKVRLDEALEDVCMDLLEDLWTFLIAKKTIGRGVEVGAMVGDLTFS